MVVFDEPDRIAMELKVATSFIEDDIDAVVNRWESEQQIMAEIWGENYSEEAMKELIKQELIPILERRLEKIFYGE
jgi:uncharacterized iron-regulated protein